MGFKGNKFYLTVYINNIMGYHTPKFKQFFFKKKAGEISLFNSEQNENLI